MTSTPSPEGLSARLRDADGIDGGDALAPLCHEAAAEISRLTERAETAASLLFGMVGLISLITNRDDMPEEMRAAILTNHRYLDARTFLHASDESSDVGGSSIEDENGNTGWVIP